MFKKPITLATASLLTLALAGCASTRPAAPSLTVLPGPGKSQAVFDRDSDICESAARRATGYQSPSEASNNSAVSGAVVGTALGALAGTAIGAASGNAGRGAAIGAGTGLLAGTAVGVGQGQNAGASVQARYDQVFAQCMNQRGHQVMAPPPPPRETVVIYERPAPPPPVYVYPRPYPYYYRY